MIHPTQTRRRGRGDDTSAGVAHGGQGWRCGHRRGGRTAGEAAAAAVRAADADADAGGGGAAPDPPLCSLWDGTPQLRLSHFPLRPKPARAAVLEKWPGTGPHAFTKSESLWLSETLRYLKKGPRCPTLRRRSQSAPPALAPAPRSSGKAEGGYNGSKKQRAAELVDSNPRFASIIFIYYDNYTHYA